MCHCQSISSVSNSVRFAGLWTLCRLLESTTVSLIRSWTRLAEVTSTSLLRTIPKLHQTSAAVTLTSWFSSLISPQPCLTLLAQSCRPGDTEVLLEALPRIRSSHEMLPQRISCQVPRFPRRIEGRRSNEVNLPDSTQCPRHRVYRGRR